MKRNSQHDKYEAERAGNLAKSRRQRRAYKLKGEVLKRVEAGLAKKDSPEQIEGRMRQGGQASVSHETIYLFVVKTQAALKSTGL